MATSTELSKTTVVTPEGYQFTATLVDVVSPDRLLLMLIRGEARAIFMGVANSTPPIDSLLRAQVVNPLSEL